MEWEVHVAFFTTSLIFRLHPHLHSLYFSRTSPHPLTGASATVRTKHVRGLRLVRSSTAFVTVTGGAFAAYVI